MQRLLPSPRKHFDQWELKLVILFAHEKRFNAGAVVKSLSLVSFVGGSWCWKSVPNFGPGVMTRKVVLAAGKGSESTSLAVSSIVADIPETSTVFPVPTGASFTDVTRMVTVPSKPNAADRLRLREFCVWRGGENRREGGRDGAQSRTKTSNPTSFPISHECLTIRRVAKGVVSFTRSAKSVWQGGINDDAVLRIAERADGNSAQSCSSNVWKYRSCDLGAQTAVRRLSRALRRVIVERAVFGKSRDLDRGEATADVFFG